MKSFGGLKNNDIAFLFTALLSLMIDNCDAKLSKIPKRDIIFTRVKTGQVGT